MTENGLDFIHPGLELLFKEQSQLERELTKEPKNNNPLHELTDSKIVK
jgi:hypothetical protein